MAAYTVTASQQSFFATNGCLVLRDVSSPAETKAPQAWAQEVHNLPRTAEALWMPYGEINAAGERVLCRTENYPNYHAGLNRLLKGTEALGQAGAAGGGGDAAVQGEETRCQIAVEWPATHKRKEGERYKEGALRYGFGSPMLSVEAEMQIGF